MNLKVIALSTLILLTISFHAHAKSQIIQFRISVTIPAIVGFNVLDEDQLSSDVKKLNQQDFDTLITEVSRHNERIVLRTLVAK